LLLDEIVAQKRGEIDLRKKAVSLDSLRDRARRATPARDFYRALQAEGFQIIAEVKRSSPSAGVLIEDYHPEEIAREYERAGAAAISVLTDEKYFGGKLEDISRVRSGVTLPLLAKDFFLDGYQIYEARAFGADAILLIVRILAQEDLVRLYSIALSLGLSVLVEVHSEDDLKRALDVQPAMLGLNNRNLDTLEVNLETTYRLAAAVPRDVLLVSESGIETPEEIRKLKKTGVKAALIGERLLRSDNPAETLRELVEAGK